MKQNKNGFEFCKKKNVVSCEVQFFQLEMKFYFNRSERLISSEITLNIFFVIPSDYQRESEHIISGFYCCT